MQPVAAKLSRLIAALDTKIAKQLNAILHHPVLQQVEAIWRNLLLLTQEAHASPRVKVRIVDVQLIELKRDFNRALEFDQSFLFEQVYHAEFGMPGGEPFGVIIMDYRFNINNYATSSVMTDVAVLHHFTQVAAAAFVPIIANLDPASFGIDQIATLALLNDLDRFFKQSEFSRWQQFRQSEGARFIGLTLPRFILRNAHELAKSENTAFPFREQINHSREVLWGNASFAFAATLIHAFVDRGWFTDIQGFGDEYTHGGLLTHLPRAYFATDSSKLMAKHTAELFISDALERRLAEQGFIALCQTHYSHVPVFYSAYSTQCQPIARTEASTINRKLAAILPYLFCACRFAHYIKVIGRDRIGSFATAQQCEQYLANWLENYVAGNQTLANPQRARYPLRAAKVTVKQKPGMPGNYSCVLHLQPRMQLEQIDTVFILVTDLLPNFQ